MSDTTDTIYAFIRQYIHQKRFAPTLREIAEGTDFSMTTVSTHLEKLEARGWIERKRYQARSIRLADDEPVAEERDDEVYAAIARAMEDQRIPTQQEIAEELYLSRSTVRQVLARLEAQGRIQREEGQRQIRLVEDD